MTSLIELPLAIILWVIAGAAVVVFGYAVGVALADIKRGR